MRWRNVGVGALAIIGPGVVAALIEYALTRGSSGWIPVLYQFALLMTQKRHQRMRQGKTAGTRATFVVARALRLVDRLHVDG